MTEEIAIKVDHVSKDFVLPHEKTSSIKSIFTNAAKNRNSKKETQHALQNISFEIKKGEFFGIVGRNGSGKSTLLKILAGIYQPTDGSVTTNGKLVPFIELGVGFNPELTGRENIYLNGAMLGFSENEVANMYEDIVNFAELERFMDQKLKNYSSGMQVRLAFSMAVRADAEILLIDEVLAVGDADFQRKCFEYFKKLKKDSTTVVFVSHDMDAVRQYCERAVLIEGSNLVEIGDSQSIAKSYTQMFMENTDAQEDHSSKKWGDKTVIITNPSVDHEDSKIIFSYTIKANTEVDSIIYGFSVRDNQGLKLIAINNKLMNEPSITLSKNQTVRITYIFDNVLNDGEYLFDAAVLEDNGINVKYWWEGAVEISIKKDRHFPSLLNLPMQVEIDKE